MFIAEHDIEEVKGEVCKLLKKWGIKLRSKKFYLKTLERKEVVGVFKFHLEKLRQDKTKIAQFDQFINVPAFLLDTCNHLRENIQTEGIFRKSGGAARQKELKQIIMNGGKLKSDFQAIDVADLLKLFFRELPEPCIPYMFHDTLERCYENSGKRKDAVFLTLLMLPTVYLHTLAYLMEFLHEVASQRMYNKMDAKNLAVVWMPNLMPFKPGRVNDKEANDKRMAIVQMLIEDANQIGVIPECLLHHIPSWHPSTSISSHDELEHSRHRYTKKKRRSGSLTRMISGIKKMVKSKVAEEAEAVTPDNSVFAAHTPRIMSTGKKRKASESNLTAFSSKKRKDVLDSLPQGALLPDICTTTHLTPRVLLPQMDKKMKPIRSLSTSRLRLSSFGFSKKHKRRVEKMEDSGLEMTATPNALDMSTSSEDYVRISRSEYEDIKNRVSRIESRISSEFENIVGVSMSDLESSPDKTPSNCVKIVQSVYEKTLESAEKLNSPTSDELATRLSRELNIRGSSRKKVIRSPSARKIGSIRRRSRERVPRVKRNLSLNIGHKTNVNDLRRRSSNPQKYDLPEALPASGHELQDNFKCNLKYQAYENQRESLSQSFDHKSLYLSDFRVMTRSQARRASSLNAGDLTKLPIFSPSVTIKNHNKPLNSIIWKNAETFLKEEEKREGQSNTGRPSLAKIRSQNAGMVLEKAKMFNTMIYSDDIKTKKNSNDVSQVVKKRNSSKGSSERRLQRKKSGNQKDSDSQKVPIETSKNVHSTESASSKVNVMNCKENLTSKENARASQKTSLQDRKAADRHYAINKLKNNNSHVHSPLRERNKMITPSKKFTPNLAPGQARQALVKSISTTPRRSPRQLSCKSKYGVK